MLYSPSSQNINQIFFWSVHLKSFSLNDYISIEFLSTPKKSLPQLFINWLQRPCFCGGHSFEGLLGNALFVC